MLFGHEQELTFTYGSDSVTVRDSERALRFRQELRKAEAEDHEFHASLRTAFGHDSSLYASKHEWFVEQLRAAVPPPPWTGPHFTN